jgi:hypothetical protein
VKGQNELVSANPTRSFAEQCEQIIVEVLAPIPIRAERIMRRLEEWLESRSPMEESLDSSQFDPARGEQLVSDLAQGMLIKELVGDGESKSYA